MDLVGSATAFAVVICGLAIPAACGLEILVRKASGHEEDEPESRLWQNVKNYKLLTATMMVGLFMVVFSSTVVWRWNGAIEQARFATPAEAAGSRAAAFLPAQAKNIDYHAAYTGFHARFDLGERDFLAWAEQQGWPLATVGESTGDKPTVVAPAEVAEDTVEAAASKTQSVFHGPFLSPEQHTIEQGYFCKIPGPTPRTGALVGYDRAQGRVYLAVIEH